MNAKNVRIIAKKEIRGLYNEKTIVFAILLQLFIAMFSSFLMVGLASLYNPDTLSTYSRVQYAIGYSGADSALFEKLEDRRDFVVFPMDLSDAVASLKERKLAAVVWVPDTPPDAKDPVKVTLYVVQNDIQASIVNIKLKDIFLDYESDLREVRADRLTEMPVPLETPDRARGGDFYEFVYGLLIPLLVFMPAIISAALIIDLITEEYQEETLETLMSSPVSYTEMVWGKVLACEVLVPVQSGAWLVLLMLNGIPIQHSLEILLHVSLASLFLILIGAMTALHYQERTKSQFVFSTALVVVILFVLAVPLNPLNLLVRLSVGTAGPEHWAILALILLATGLLCYGTSLYARHIGRQRIRLPSPRGGA